MTVATEALNICGVKSFPGELDKLIALRRVQHTTVSLALTVMHVYNVYLYSGHGHPQNALNEQLLSCVFADIQSLGNVPVAILGDFQGPPMRFAC
eukprot:13297401-Heterocapsa_arctica.AAC.1